MSGFLRHTIFLFKDCKLTVDGGLTRKLLQHLGGTGKSVTRLSDGDVQDELLDAELPHGVLGLLRLAILLVKLASYLRSLWSHHDGGVVDFPVLGVVDEFEIWKG
jgi:hypothetical protein